MNVLCSLALGSFEEALDLKTVVPSMGNLFEEEMVKRWEDAWGQRWQPWGKLLFTLWFWRPFPRHVGMVPF